MTEEKYIPIVKIETLKLSDHNYNDYLSERKYKTSDLIKQSEKYKEFDLPLAGINLATTPWGVSQNINSICYHLKRINEVDMKYPILLDRDGFICDGWHRVCKAIIEKRKTIKAIRLEKMPKTYKKIKK